MSDTLEDLMLDGGKYRHCDEFISDPSVPMALRWYLFISRMPAINKAMCHANGVDPILYAKYEGAWVRVVVASRLGDLGITEDLDAKRGYSNRVAVEQLSDFTNQDPR